MYVACYHVYRFQSGVKPGNFVVPHKTPIASVCFDDNFAELMHDFKPYIKKNSGFLLVVFYLLAFGTNGQVTLELRDLANGEPVADAVVEIVTGEGETVFFTSDEKGSVVAERLELPVSIFIQHLGYERLQRTIESQTRIVIDLEPRSYHMEDVVVTGQYHAQSTHNSVYRVKSINKEEIERMAGSDLAEVMSFVQNVNLDRDQNLNGQSASFLGLGGNNIKILLDGSPLSGRTALVFDLSQINLSNIEKIEIVEGPMSVEYGSNALAGVINIITKKKLAKYPLLELKIQEETIGSSYGVDKGIHDQSISLQLPLFEKISTTTTLEHKYFGGSFETEDRSSDWDPKQQIFGDIKLQTTLRNADLSMRTSYYKDWIDNLGDAEGPLQNRAQDDHYKARRWNQHLSFGKYYENLGRVDAKVSFSDFKRIKNSYITSLPEGKSNLSQAEGAQDTSSFQNISTWLHHTVLSNEKLKIKWGLDAQYDKTSGGRILNGTDKTSFDGAIFSSAEFVLSDFLTIKPGLRWAYNNRFKTPLIPSMHTLIRLTETSTIRLGYARGFRAPALRELFFEFVDNSHTIFGNPNLRPETSDYVDVSFTHMHRSSTGLKQKLSSRFFYTSARDQITFAQDATNATVTTLMNVDSYKAFGLSLNQHIYLESIEVSAGAAVIAAKNQLSSIGGTKNYLATPEITLSIKADVLETPLQIISQFKYHGKEPTYALANDGSNGNPAEAILAKSQDYYIMDVIGKYTLTNQLTISGGIKNLFDVTNVQVGNGSSFHQAGGEVAVGYGRSVFLRLNYQIKM